MAETARLLVLYHSADGHVETLAYTVAHGVRAVEGVHVSVKRVPELMPEEAMHAAGMKLEQLAPIADPQELPNYDGIIFISRSCIVDSRWQIINGIHGNRYSSLV